MDELDIIDLQLFSEMEMSFCIRMMKLIGKICMNALEYLFE